MSRPVPAGRLSSVVIPTPRYMYARGYFPSRPRNFFDETVFAADRDTRDCALLAGTDRRAAFALCVPKDDRSTLPLN